MAAAVRATPSSRAGARGRRGKPGFPAPVDPQNWENPDHMTWADYKPIPGTDWADPAVGLGAQPSSGALVLVDYPNQSFVGHRSRRTPRSSATPAPRRTRPARATCPQFYRDFLNKPEPLNRGHTIHEYWMEDSGGRYGVELTEFGAYQMPGKSHEYAHGVPGRHGLPDRRLLRPRPAHRRAAPPGRPRRRRGRATSYDFVFYPQRRPGRVRPPGRSSAR